MQGPREAGLFREPLSEIVQVSTSQFRTRTTLN